MRNTNHAHWFAFAHRAGFIDVSGDVWTGDVVMSQPGPAQQHLMIAESKEFVIHAHAGLGRVVRQPASFPRNPLAHWRLP